MNLIKEPLTEEVISEIKKILSDTIQNDLRHKYYTRTQEVYKKSYAYSSGNGLDAYLQKFQPRETEELFKQRIELTKHIIPAVINNLDFLLNKTLRSPAIKIKYTNPDKTKLNALQTVEGVYYQNKNVKEFFNKKQRLMDRTDPNSWLITEFNSTDGSELTQPYPFIADSIQAINYETINGLLNWLIIQVERDFTIYTPNQNIKYVFIADVPTDSKEQETWLYSKLTEDYDTIDLDGTIYIRLKSKIYRIDEPEPHNIGFVTARRFGFNFDTVTYGETYVPFWWDAECYLSKILKINSELDLTMCLHNFPQKFVYAPRCTHLGCNGGYMPEGGKCPICHGSGTIVHTSAQDVVELPLPGSKEEMIPLADLINYIYPPVDGMEFTNKKIHELVADCKNAIFNSDIFSRKEIAETATSKVIDLQSIYDTLYPFAVNYTENWSFVIESIAKITSTDTGLIIVASVEKDFKFKTKEELIAELQLAKNAGADNEILRVLQDEIMEVIFLDSPSQLLKYKIIDKFNPFSGKSDEEITFLMSSNHIPQQKKILYANMGYVFDELARETPNFFDMEETKQIELINAKVEEIIKSLPQAPQLNLNNLETE